MKTQKRQRFRRRIRNTRRKRLFKRGGEFGDDEKPVYPTFGYNKKTYDHGYYRTPTIRRIIKSKNNLKSVEFPEGTTKGFSNTGLMRNDRKEKTRKQNTSIGDYEKILYANRFGLKNHETTKNDMQNLGWLKTIKKKPLTESIQKEKQKKNVTEKNNVKFAYDYTKIKKKASLPKFTYKKLKLINPENSNNSLQNSEQKSLSKIMEGKNSISDDLDPIYKKPPQGEH